VILEWLIRSAMRDMYPRTEHFPGIAECGDTEFIARFRRETSFLLWLGVVAGTWLYVLTPVLTVYVPLPSFLLPAALRDRHAQRITSTRIYLLRQAIFVLKMVAGLCWGASADVRQKIGLSPYLPDTEGYRVGDGVRRSVRPASP
jgi:hypothetical protein